MQSVEIKRSPATRIGIAALAVAILTAITLVIIVSLAVDDETALAPAVAAPNISEFEQIRLLEDNIPLPVYAGSPTRPLTEMQLMEENVEFQMQVSNPVLSYLDMKLIEDNVALPIYSVSAMRIHANMQVEE